MKILQIVITKSKSGYSVMAMSAKATVSRRDELTKKQMLAEVKRIKLR